MRKIQQICLLTGILILFIGLYAGLLRLNLPLPGNLAVFHGPLMVCGFLGVLIGLERAARHGGLWSFLVPVSAAGGALCLWFAQISWALYCWLFSVILHVFVFLRIHWPLQGATHSLSLSGLWAWFSALIFWFGGQSIRLVSLVLLLFPVLTILAERWPMALRGPCAFILSNRLGHVLAVVFGFLIWVIFLWPTYDLPWRFSGLLFMGTGLSILISLWKQQTSSSHGSWEGYFKGGLFLSYGWFILGGAWLFFYAQSALLEDPFYDVLIHSVGIGFILGNIFAYFPRVLTTLSGLELPFRTIFFFPLGLLHMGLGLRVLGKMGGTPWLWQLGGSLNVLAVLAFMGVVILGIKGLRSRSKPSTGLYRSN